MEIRTYVHLFHILFVGSLFLYVGIQRTAIPSIMYPILLGLGLFIIFSHIYKAYNYMKLGKGYWVNLIHIFYNISKSWLHNVCTSTLIWKLTSTLITQNQRILLQRSIKLLIVLVIYILVELQSQEYKNLLNNFHSFRKLLGVLNQKHKNIDKKCSNKLENFYRMKT
jgi:MFS superfamily sulfate permease-like transporter